MRKLIPSLLFLTLIVAACNTTTEAPEATPTVELDNFTARASHIQRDVITVDCAPLLQAPVPVPLQVAMISGRTRSGAEFLLYKPLDFPSNLETTHKHHDAEEEDSDEDGIWNGDLVLYAHGYIAPDDSVGFPDPLPADLLQVRDALLCPIPGVKGAYAAAASSYSRNGFAVKEGARDTHVLNAFFRYFFDKPHHTYIVGRSLGGLVTVKLAELFPWRYDGALPLCGITGGSLLQMQYLGHLRVLFDYFYNADGSLIPGDALNVPAGLDWDAIRVAVQNTILGPFAAPSPPTTPGGIAAATAALVKALGMASVQIQGLEAIPLMQFDTTLLAGLPSNPADFPNWIAANYAQARLLMQELTTAMVRPLFYSVVGTNDVLNRTRGQSPFDNSSVVYVSNLLTPPQLLDLNAKVDRFSAGLFALFYLALNYQPHGPSIPTIDVHTILDQDVPFFHQLAYYLIAGGNLASFPTPLAKLTSVPLLPVNPDPLMTSHCSFDPATILTAFLGLVNWVENGIPPSLPQFTGFTNSLTIPETMEQQLQNSIR